MAKSTSVPSARTIRQASSSLRKLSQVLIRPAFDEYKAANPLVRDIAREVSPHRDARIMAELVDDLFVAGDESGGEGNAAERWFWLRCDLAEQHAVSVLETLKKRVADAAVTVEKWDVARIGPADAVDGLLKTLGRAHACYEELGQFPDTPPVRKYHEWRKRSKYHFFHLRLLDIVKRRIVFQMRL